MVSELVHGSVDQDYFPNSRSEMKSNEPLKEDWGEFSALFAVPVLFQVLRLSQQTWVFLHVFTGVILTIFYARFRVKDLGHRSLAFLDKISRQKSPLIR